MSFSRSCNVLMENAEGVSAPQLTSSSVQSFFIVQKPFSQVGIFAEFSFKPLQHHLKSRCHFDTHAAALRESFPPGHAEFATKS